MPFVLHLRRFASLLAVLGLSLALVACGGDDNNPDTTGGDTSTDTAMDSTPDTAVDTAADVMMSEGQMLYEMTPGGTPCASCHGATGMGDGVLATAYNPPPTDFTTYMGSAMDIETAIKDGVGDMPGNPGLTDAQVTAITEYVMTTF